MLDDFLLRAGLAGFAIAAIAGPLGCFVVWRRMAYFGATLAHAALLGVAFGLLLSLDPMLGILLVTLSVALLFLALERRRLVARDTLLGILAHATLAGGLILVSFLENVRIDLMAVLFGDILAVSGADLMLTGGAALGGLAALALLWRPLLAATVDHDLAVVEGQPANRAETLFTLLLALIIAIGMKLIGLLLIVSMLIIPPAAARPLSASPERMALLASAIGMVSVFGGLAGSLHWDLPSGAAIVAAASLLFVATTLLRRWFRR